MTGIAGARWLTDRVIGTVASGASRARMLAQQGEARIARVIEGRRFPACG